jgi:hypothetical protein
MPLELLAELEEVLGIETYPMNADWNGKDRGHLR